MDQPPVEYTIELYRQFSFLAAVLGGFAITFMGTLLTLDAKEKVVARAIWVSAFAATFLIVSTFTSVVTLLDVIRLNISAFDFSDWPANTLRAKVIADVTSFTGMYALLIAIGISGWIRDKRTGIITSFFAFVGLSLLTIVALGIF